MTLDFDVTIIGTGVVGLAVAREYAHQGRTVLVLEAAARSGTETSSRNSEVIHAGIYYPTGTLKAQLCVEGRALLYDYCAAHGVATRRLGKLIVASSPAEEAKLEAIMAQAKANGVDDLQWLTAAEALVLEPEVRCSKALFSPSTGIVDAAGFMLSLQAGAEAAGATFAFNSPFERARKQDGVFVLQAAGAEITSRILINAAGHGAHDAARAIEGFDPAHLPPRYFARGNYCSLAGKSPFTHLVYPIPVAGGLGIHATLDMGGAVRFGPNVEWIERLDYGMPDGLPQQFAAAIAHYWPAVSKRELVPSYCGVRPKIQGPAEGFADFMIQTEAEHGLSHLVNLFGIESPGLTSSLALARCIARLA